MCIFQYYFQCFWIETNLQYTHTTDICHTRNKQNAMVNRIVHRFFFVKNDNILMICRYKMRCDSRNDQFKQMIFSNKKKFFVKELQKNRH